MDLADLAGRLVGGAARDAAVSWFADLSTSLPYGDSVIHHVEGEVNLQTTSEGRESIRLFAEALRLRPPGEDPVVWYERLLSDPATAPDLVLHGPAADPSLPDELCRLIPAWNVLHDLGGVDAPNIPPVALGGDPTRLENWLQRVCSPAYLDLLDRSKLVSGKVPSVFSAFEADRDATFPPGTSAQVCRQILGLIAEPTPSAHALVKYRKRVVGPARLPTAFDASTHPHFVPPTVGAPCGRTQNLATPGAGVREVVVARFPVRQLDEPEFVPR
jgi:hypothetical protein